MDCNRDGQRSEVSFTHEAHRRCSTVVSETTCDVMGGGAYSLPALMRVLCHPAKRRGTKCGDAEFA